MRLSDLMEVVVRHWVFDESNYPELAGLSEESRKAFALRHVLMHQQKAAGRLAEVCEPFDHGATLDAEKVRVAARNFLINTLRLAAIIGTADDLATAVQDWAARKHTP